MYTARCVEDVKKTLLMGTSSFYNVAFATNDNHIGFATMGKFINKAKIDS